MSVTHLYIAEVTSETELVLTNNPALPKTSGIEECLPAIGMQPWLMASTNGIPNPS